MAWENAGVQPATGAPGGDRQRTAAVRFPTARYQIADANGPMLARSSSAVAVSWTFQLDARRPRRDLIALHMRRCIIVSGGSNVGIRSRADGSRATWRSGHSWDLRCARAVHRPGRMGHRRVSAAGKSGVVSVPTISSPAGFAPWEPQRVAMPVDARPGWRARSARRSDGWTTLASVVTAVEPLAVGGASVLVDDEGRRLRHRPGDSEVFPAGGGLALCVMGAFLHVLDRDQAERRHFRPAAIDLTPRGIRAMPARCRTPVARAGRRPSLARRRALVRPLDVMARRLQHENSGVECADAGAWRGAIGRRCADDGEPVRHGGVDCHRGGSARRRCRSHGRARRERPPAPAKPSRREAGDVCRPTSLAADSASPGASR